MKIIVQKFFEKDIAKINDKELAAIVYLLIEELEDCQNLSKVTHLKNGR